MQNISDKATSLKKSILHFLSFNITQNVFWFHLIIYAERHVEANTQKALIQRLITIVLC